jgi:regulator of protease activity HflC (stomatin/prohibitin superfamily)
MKLLMTLVIAALTVGCRWAAPDAGTEGVLVRKPILWGHGGVADEPVKTGRTLIAPTTEVVYVPITPVQFSVHFDDLMSSDGVPLDFDAVIRVQVTDSVRLVRDFGPQWYQNNVEAELRNRVRQAVRKHGMNETAIQTSAIESIDTEISAAMTAYIKEAALPVRLIQVTVGRANPPDAIKSQRIATAEQEQRANTERQRKLAEDQRKEAETARASADNAYRNAMSLSPEQFLRLEAIQMQREVCQKGSCTFILGDATPVVNVR